MTTEVADGPGTGSETPSSSTGTVAGVAPSGVPPRWWQGDLATAGVIAVLWQAAFTVLGNLLEHSEGMAKGITNHAPSLLNHMLKWDGLWFQKVFNGAYAFNAQSPAFYPLFPFTVWAVQGLSFGMLTMVWAGLIVNTVSTWLAIAALRKIARFFVDSTWAGWLAVVAFLTVPSAFFMHEFYSEALFTAIGFWAYLFALRRQWIAMVCCLIPLTACRLTAVLFVGLCFLEFFRSVRWRPLGLISPVTLFFPLSLLGFGVYAWRLEIVRGDPLAMFHAYKATNDWFYHVYNPNIVQTLAIQFGNLTDAIWGDAKFTEHTFADLLLPFGGLALLVAASLYAIFVMRGPGIPLGLFGFSSLVMFTLNSNLVSVYRYLLPCLGTYLVMARLAEKYRASWPVLGVTIFFGAIIQGIMFLMFSLNVWAG